MKKLISFDIETYKNYTLFAFRGIDSQTLITIEIIGENNSLAKEQRKRLHHILSKYTTVTFNGNKFDLPITQYALTGATALEIQQAAQGIITSNAPDFITYKKLGVEPRGGYDSFDLSEPAPAVFTSLKTYGTRIGSKKLWDLPYDPQLTLAPDEMEILKSYCENDLQVTEDLYHSIKHEIDLREFMGKEYGVDLRSKSGAQVAEMVLLKETNYRGGKPDVPKSIRYRAPKCVKFHSPELTELVQSLEDEVFAINQGNGQPVEPEWMKKNKLAIGQTPYKLGLGGIHDKRKKSVYNTNDTHIILDIDVASYYPSMIIEFGFTPKHIGKKFLDVYTKIYKNRFIAKRSGDKQTSNSLKLVLNSSFGKMGSRYSKLYAPDVMLQVTITGQLMLMMLIEDIEREGVEVFYANTDGITINCPRDKRDLIETIVFDWELHTGMVMETAEFKSVAIRDVNNFVNITMDGEVKSKGAYANTSLSKGRATPIAYEAVRKFLLDDTPLEDTIHECKDINEFVSARSVRGGGEYEGKYLGKTVRWIYDTRSVGYISYKSNGNKVPKTDNSYPMMDLVSEIPTTLNYAWYVNEAKEALKNLGVTYDV